MAVQKIAGGCHCGAVRYEAKADLSKAIECNCSHCAKVGLILTFTLKSDFNLLKGETSLTEYRFNKKVLAHLFCKDCGVQSFAYGRMPDGTPTAAINLRSVDGIDLAALSPQKFDGRSL